MTHPKLDSIRARLASQNGALTLAMLRGDRHTENTARHWVKLIERELAEELARIKANPLE